MSYDFGSPSPIQPLSLGNVVSAGLRLYRSHLKDYFLLALKAYVWLLVPVYGWAKFYALSALISRLAFGELVNQPESMTSAQRFVNSRLWQFFVTMLLMFLLSVGIGVGAFILFIIFGFLSSVLLGGIGQQGNTSAYAVLSLLIIVVSIVGLVAVLWLLTRFFLVDVPLAIEDNVDGTSTIGRSWELTQGYFWRVFLILFVAFLITIPIQVIVQIITTIIQLVFTSLLEQDSFVFRLIFFLLVMALSFVSGALILPFWQTIKAVVYYDLRSRREGLGLKLRDHEI
ncbi:glycerophosphoryl diester phosphodiesterase membrane domain-containing protein [Mastigocladopsis repens]|uniref:glycerophosphoryl diester phosphodiesterase membrane domain-containing protein n=1 Tax=Mastigocladopsis repens TaxID=221287 RepID=UPI00030114D0|nr:glycerophosphoryl diester phosphodiesterase membrane domain-containing protein [Mastigocladopsis repens]